MSVYYILSASAFVLGLIIGSFLNVVALRYNTGFSFWTGRSRCFTCNKNLEWYELVPLVSFLAQGGKCRGCHSKISIQYPIVEAVTAIVFGTTFLRVGLSPELFYLWCVWGILIVICVYDLKHQIIPDALAFVFGLLSFIALFWGTSGFVIPPWGALLAGPALALPFFLLWLVSRGRWIGLGDAKLAVGVGWFLGGMSGLSAMVLAFWIGAGWSIVALTVIKLNKRHLKSGRKQLTMKSEIPFAPFIILAVVLVYFFHFNLFPLPNF